MCTIAKMMKLVVTVEFIHKLTNSVCKLQLLRRVDWTGRLSEYCVILGELFGLLFRLHDHRVLLAEAKLLLLVDRHHR